MSKTGWSQIAEDFVKPAMTDEEAIRVLETLDFPCNYCPISTNCGNTGLGCNGAFRLSISALRERIERESPKPLTLDELREMDGEPVWVVPNRGIAKWYLVDVANDACETCDMDVVDFELYGPENKSYGWLAYRYKPKEAQDER